MFVAEPKSRRLRLHHEVLTRESEGAYKTPKPVPGLLNMAVRSIFAFAVMLAVQTLAGCGMPAESGVAHDDPPAWRKVELDAREARSRRQIEAGTFGLAQLFPGGMSVDARNVPPLPSTSSVPMPVVLVGVTRTSPSETPVQVALAVAQGRSNACVYKPIMSDADIAACR